MVELTIAEVSRAIGGSPVDAAWSGRRVRGVSIDSRTTARGAIFFAIVGQRLDGHAFVAEAAQAGAGLLVVQRPLNDEALRNTPVVQVEDTTAALGRLAGAWRQRVDPTVVAITGSVGKTTTKELVQQILRLDAPTQHTRGNLNNHIGVPLTLLDLAEGTRYAVVEMGMNAPGEIAYLSRMAQPDLACITALAPVHLERLGNMEAIARAKAEVLAGLAEDGQLVLPAEEPLLAHQLDLAGTHSGQQRVIFGRAEGCDVQIAAIETRGVAGSRVDLSLGGDRISVDLPLPGSHNAHNAAAAAAIALALKIAPAHIQAGLSALPELGHRSRVIDIESWRVVDDCYNASPVAMKAALEMLVELAAGQPAVAVLGQMLELGEHTTQLHREVGAFAATLNLDLLVTVGAEAAEIARAASSAGLASERIVTVAGTAEAAKQLRAQAPAGSWILVKASRGMRLERTIVALAADRDEPAAVDQTQTTA